MCVRILLAVCVHACDVPSGIDELANNMADDHDAESIVIDVDTQLESLVGPGSTKSTADRKPSFTAALADQRR